MRMVKFILWRTEPGMRIAISQRVVENEKYVELRDALAQDWVNWITTVFPNSAILGVPNLPTNVGIWWQNTAPDLLILSGGNNWSEAPTRDKTEKLLVAFARESNTPIIGVCRGLQSLNRIFGGKIESSIFDRTGQNHVAHSHNILFSETPFLEMAGKNLLSVNSFHTQGVMRKGLAPDLREFATTTEGVVEGLYHPTEAIVAIQWHPERPGPSADFDQKLTRTLVNQGVFWRKERF